jgi:hypothetical protein
MLKHFYFGLVLAFAAVLPPSAGAQSGNSRLPAARDLIARHVAAIGGRVALLSKRSVRARGTFEMPAMSVRGEFEAAQSQSGSMVMKVTIPGLGEMQSGYDGAVGWAMNPATGPKLLSGNELRQARDEASMLAVLREAPAVAGVETTELSTLGGRRCYKVRVTWASGRRTFDCYSVETGLLVGTQSVQESPGGALDISTTLGEYREFDGIKVATVLTQRAAGQEQVLRITAYEFDSVEASAFAPPTAIAELRRQQPASTQ